MAAGIGLLGKRRGPAWRVVLAGIAAAQVLAGVALAQSSPRQAGEPVVIEFPAQDQAARARQDRIEELERQLVAAAADSEDIQRELQAARQRIRELEAQVAELLAAPTAAEAAAPALPPATPEETFAAANASMRTGQLDQAEAGFRSLLAAHPDAPQAAEARFWLAEILMARSAHGDAAAAYADFLDRFPRHPLSPDAQARLGLALGLSGRVPAGCAALRDVVPQYPNASRFTRDRVLAALRQLRCPA